MMHLTIRETISRVSLFQISLDWSIKKKEFVGNAYIVCDFFPDASQDKVLKQIHNDAPNDSRKNESLFTLLDLIGAPD